MAQCCDGTLWLVYGHILVDVCNDVVAPFAYRLDRLRDRNTDARLEFLELVNRDGREHFEGFGSVEDHLAGVFNGIDEGFPVLRGGICYGCVFGSGLFQLLVQDHSSRASVHSAVTPPDSE